MSTERCAGQVVDHRFEIIKKIGSGGTSAVYLARHVRAGKLWAIKEIRPDARVGREIAWNSLNAEIEILKRLSHPLLPRIVDVVEDAERFYVIMDYFEGWSLHDLLLRYDGMGVVRTLKIGIALCDVLQYLHSLNPPVIYRDLKPANIILRPDGQIRLIDFGAAISFGRNPTGLTCDGTPAYAAPEQLQGMSDERSDIYCLGRTLYHICTGCVPTAATKRLGSPYLARVIALCTERDPGARYASASELKKDLRRALAIENGSVKRLKKKCAMFAGSVLLMCACIVSGFVLRHNASVRIRDAYTAYMDEAIGETNEEKRTEAYMRAMTVDPAREDAYLDLLERVYLSDAVFSREEDAALHEILMTKGADGRTFSEILEDGKNGMDYLHYRLGLAYYYCYEGTGSKTLAFPHLKTASESGILPQERRLMAEHLSTIAGYYARLGSVDRSGDDSVRYAVYWEDLEETLSEGLSGSENLTTELMICKEVLYQVHMNAGRYKADGIDRARIEEALRQVDAFLKANTQELPSQELATLRGNLSDTVTLARQTIQAVYAREDAHAKEQVQARAGKKGE